MLKKLVLSSALLSLLLSPLGNASANAESDVSQETTMEEINLEKVDFEKLQDGEEIQVDGFTIKHYSNEEAAELIAEQKGTTTSSELRNLGGKTNKSLITPMASSCASGATAFSRTLNVKSNYKPTMHVWTELCKNSAGQFVIKSIVDITINKSYNGMVKGFGGSVKAQALNSGKTLYYRAEGNFYNNASTTINSEAGLDTRVATISFGSSSTSDYFGYIHQAQNIYLFK
ncbi:hypothetical protein LG276_18960 [Cytobacillus kochii]|uniref:hypothetical protein n=1 Tax=Cytobacillus kochii TaxID=859143 RepID=UPI00385120EE